MSPDVSLTILHPAVSFVIDGLVFSVIFQILNACLHCARSPGKQVPSIADALLAVLHPAVVVIINGFLLICDPLKSGSGSSVFVEQIPLAADVLLSAAMRNGTCHAIHVICSAADLLATILHLASIVVIDDFALTCYVLESGLHRPGKVVKQIPVPVDMLLTVKSRLHFACLFIKQVPLAIDVLLTVHHVAAAIVIICLFFILTLLETGFFRLSRHHRIVFWR